MDKMKNFKRNLEVEEVKLRLIEDYTVPQILDMLDISDYELMDVLEGYIRAEDTFTWLQEHLAEEKDLDHAYS